MKRTISVCVRHSDRMIVSRAIIGMPYAPLMIRTHSAIFDFHLLAVRTLSAHHQTHGTKIVPMSVKIAPMSQSPPQNAWTRIHQSTRPVVTNTLFTVTFFMVSLLPYGHLSVQLFFIASEHQLFFVRMIVTEPIDWDVEQRCDAPKIQHRRFSQTAFEERVWRLRDADFFRNFSLRHFGIDPSCFQTITKQLQSLLFIKDYNVIFDG